MKRLSLILIGSLFLVGCCAQNKKAIPDECQNIQVDDLENCIAEETIVPNE